METDVEKAKIVTIPEGMEEEDDIERVVEHERGFESLGQSKEDIDTRIGRLEQPICGQIFNADNNQAIVLASQDTFVQVKPFESVAISQFVEASATDGQIVIIEPGLYQILLSMSYSTTATANTYELEIQLNRGTRRLTHLHAERKTAAGGDIASVSVSGFENLIQSDSVEIWVQRTDGGGSSKTLTIRDSNLAVIKVG